MALDTDIVRRSSVSSNMLCICPICASKVLISWDFPIEKCYCVGCDKEIIPLGTPQEIDWRASILADIEERRVALMSPQEVR